MGLFDFIKKKLFGKTKKVEESEKIKKKKVTEKKQETPKAKPKSEKKAVVKKKKTVPAKAKEKEPKKSFFRGITQLFRIVRFATHAKVNFHGNN